MGRRPLNVLNQLVSDSNNSTVTLPEQFSGFTGLIGLAASPIVGIMKAVSGAMDDLAPERMAVFNQKYKDVPTVKYYSVTSTFKPWFNHLF